MAAGDEFLDPILALGSHHDVDFKTALARQIENRLAKLASEAVKIGEAIEVTEDHGVARRERMLRPDSQLECFHHQGSGLEPVR